MTPTLALAALLGTIPLAALQDPVGPPAPVPASDVPAPIDTPPVDPPDKDHQQPIEPPAIPDPTGHRNHILSVDAAGKLTWVAPEVQTLITQDQTYENPPWLTRLSESKLAWDTHERAEVLIAPKAGRGAPAWRRLDYSDLPPHNHGQYLESTTFWHEIAAYHRRDEPLMVSQVDGLEARLRDIAPAVHRHPKSQIDGLETTLQDFEARLAKLAPKIVDTLTGNATLTGSLTTRSAAKTPLRIDVATPDGANDAIWALGIVSKSGDAMSLGQSGKNYGTAGPAPISWLRPLSAFLYVPEHQSLLVGVGAKGRDPQLEVAPGGVKVTSLRAGRIERHRDLVAYRWSIPSPAVGQDVAERWTVPFRGAIRKVVVDVRDAPDGGPLVVDIRANGTSLWADRVERRPAIQPGEHGVATTAFGAGADVVDAEAKLTLDVVQVGTARAGGRLVVEVFAEVEFDVVTR